MKQGNYIIGIIILLAFLIGGAFYWFQLRPAQIREFCAKEVQKTTTKSLSEFVGKQITFDENYKKCLKEHGLEK